MSLEKSDLKLRTYIFAIKLLKFVRNFDKKDFSLEIIGKQVLRSGTSIGANVIEAKASPSRKDFANFYHHALKSANETRFWLGLLRDSGIMNEKRKEIESLLNESVELSKILGKSLVSLKKN